eukprot:CFRG8494T1
MSSSASLNPPLGPPPQGRPWYTPMPPPRGTGIYNNPSTRPQANAGKRALLAAPSGPPPRQGPSPHNGPPPSQRSGSHADPHPDYRSGTQFGPHPRERHGDPTDPHREGHRPGHPTGPSLWVPSPQNIPPQASPTQEKPMHSWNTVRDPATGRPYYWNTDTNAVVWEIPPELAAGEQQSGSQALPVTNSKNLSNSALHLPQHGKSYATSETNTKEVAMSTENFSQKCENAPLQQSRKEQFSSEAQQRQTNPSAQKKLDAMSSEGHSYTHHNVPSQTLSTLETYRYTPSQQSQTEQTKVFTDAPSGVPASTRRAKTKAFATGAPSCYEPSSSQTYKYKKKEQAGPQQQLSSNMQSPVDSSTGTLTSQTYQSIPSGQSHAQQPGLQQQMESSTGVQPEVSAGTVPEVTSAPGYQSYQYSLTPKSQMRQSQIQQPVRNANGQPGAIFQPYSAQAYQAYQYQQGQQSPRQRPIYQRRHDSAGTIPSLPNGSTIPVYQQLPSQTQQIPQNEPTSLKPHGEAEPTQEQTSQKQNITILWDTSLTQPSSIVSKFVPRGATTGPGPGQLPTPNLPPHSHLQIQPAYPHPMHRNAPQVATPMFNGHYQQKFQHMQMPQYQLNHNQYPQHVRPQSCHPNPPQCSHSQPQYNYPQPPLAQSQTFPVSAPPGPITTTNIIIPTTFVSHATCWKCGSKRDVQPAGACFKCTFGFDRAPIKKVSKDTKPSHSAAKPYMRKEFSTSAAVHEHDDNGTQIPATSVRSSTVAGGEGNIASPAVMIDKTNSEQSHANFDPMDPSSYSDAPVGGWSVGIGKDDT